MHLSYGKVPQGIYSFFLKKHTHTTNTQQKPKCSNNMYNMMSLLSAIAFCWCLTHPASMQISKQNFADKKLRLGISLDHHREAITEDIAI